MSLQAPFLLAGALFVTFQPPHAARLPAATLDEAFTRNVDARVRDAPSGMGALVRLSLDVTSTELHFGLDHKTTLHFTPKEREGNCIEYAHLFAAIFNRAAKAKQVAARAYVVHSDARVLGEKLPGRGLGDHDWVLVVPDAKDAPRLFVDPTFYDLGLDWNIAGAVTGKVSLP